MAPARPGGRTARTKTAAFEAAAALLVEKGAGAVTMTDIAQRAGVAATSLYRRWGDVGALLMEVAVEQLMREAPLPDTGSLTDDLRTWARSIAAGLRSPGGSAFFRVFIATAPAGPARGHERTAALSRRFEQIDGMLERARRRGEAAPSVAEVGDHILAPLYIRTLFGIPADEAFAEHLADRLLATPFWNGAPVRD